MVIRKGVIKRENIVEFVEKYGPKEAIRQLSLSTGVSEEVVEKRIEMAGYKIKE